MINIPDIKSKQQNLPLSKEERKLATLKAQKAKELAFKLVVKIISWESGSSGSIAVQAANKISPEEWSQYKKQQMSIATMDNRDKTKEKLAQTFNSIKANGGFK